MTSRSPSSCLYAVSSITVPRRHAAFGVFLRSAAIRAPSNLLLRDYATHRPKYPKAPTQSRSQRAIARQSSSPPIPAVGAVGHEAYSPKAALLAVELGNMQDTINPPISTLPPPLELPNRSGEPNVFSYLWRLGRAYGGFYKNGVKAVWFNRKAARLLQEQIEQRVEKHCNPAARGKKTLAVPVKDKVLPFALARGLMTRAENEILVRHQRDIGKLPLFGLLVVCFGEWLPLIVPFMPSVVPGTCLIPAQIAGMRNAAEERRRTSFREGIVLPASTFQHLRDLDHGEKDHDAAAGVVLGLLPYDQLLHMSTTLGLHKRLWDRLHITPPKFLLRRALIRRSGYISQDDMFLALQGGIACLSSPELAIACELRGIDVLHKNDTVLRDILTRWLKEKQKGRGFGTAFLEMLFTRPSTWGERSEIGT